MQNEPIRRDPNQILSALKQQENKNRGGRLYIFLGMCPGVGKTYAMLEHAHTEFKNGQDITIAAVETHGRAQTAKLLDGLPQLPQKEVEYKGKMFKELDLPAILAKKPKIVVIDELAHTNIPGLTHEKRWQDVEEILNNNIDVYTTINIQHVESRKEDVELITGINIRETVPDAIFERAQQIELVDIPPAQLLERLLEGNVYLGGQNIELASNSFFKQDKLTALREIALRFAGDVVGSELESLSLGAQSKSTRGKILILLAPGVETKKIIRAGRKFAFASDSEFFALIIENTHNLNHTQKQSLMENTELARGLNAEILNMADGDAISGIKNTIQQYGITRIILPKSQKNIFKDIFSGGSLITRLLNETEVDVHIIRNTHFLNPAKRFSFDNYIYFETKYTKYLKVLGAVLIASAFNLLVYKYAGYQAVGFMYLLLVLGAGALTTMGPILFCALASMLAWDFFFIPPLFTIYITKPEDLVMCFVFLTAALVTGFRTNKLLQNQQFLRRREQRIITMLQIAQAINSPLDNNALFKEISKQLNRILKGSFIFTFKNNDGEFERYNPHPSLDSWLKAEKEFSVGIWCMKNNTVAGWNTDTLSLSKALYIPLSTSQGLLGFLAYIPQDYKNPVSHEDVALLRTIAGQAAVFFGNELLKDKTEKIKQLEEAQKIYQVVLNSISHELKTPLTIINGAVDILVRSTGRDITPLEDLKEATFRLNREINNILDMSRLNAQKDIKRDWNDIYDILSSCLQKLKYYTAKNIIDIDCQTNLPFVRVNFALFESLITNLIVNAVKYAPAGSAIKIRVYAKVHAVYMEVSDTGPGVDENEINAIFDKFYRAKNATTASGMGLGLSIAKSVVQLHGGQITARNTKPHGFVVEVKLPLEEQPKI